MRSIKGLGICTESEAREVARKIIATYNSGNQVISIDAGRKMMNDAYALIGLDVNVTDQDVESYINEYDLTESGQPNLDNFCETILSSRFAQQAPLLVHVQPQQPQVYVSMTPQYSSYIKNNMDLLNLPPLNKIQKIQSEIQFPKLYVYHIESFKRKCTSFNQSQLDRKNFTIKWVVLKIKQKNQKELDCKLARNILTFCDIDYEKIGKEILLQKMINFLTHIKFKEKPQENENFCEICYQNENKMQIFCTCNKQFCNTCLKQYLSILVSDRSTVLQIICPHEGCKNIIDDIVIKNNLEEEQYLKYIRIKQLALLEKQQNIIWCSKPGCENTIGYGPGQDIIECNLCNSKTCVLCREMGHEGKTCEQNIDSQMDEQLFKKCPSCKCYIEKESGCNHITCKCGFNFCWLCMQPYNKNHYSDSQSQCFEKQYEGADIDLEELLLEELVLTRDFNRY